MKLEDLAQETVRFVGFMLLCFVTLFGALGIVFGFAARPPWPIAVMLCGLLGSIVCSWMLFRRQWFWGSLGLSVAIPVLFFLLSRVGQKLGWAGFGAPGH